MRNMFNEKEKTAHIILLAMENAINTLLKGKALTIKEIIALTKVSNSINEFHNLVFERFGLPYKKKIEGTMQANAFGFYAKEGEEKKCISYCASEDVYELGKRLRGWECCDCDKCNHLDCGVYAMLCAVDSKINDKEDGCPYKF